MSSEGHDRTDLLLPGHQSDLLKQLQQATSGKNPMIVVVMSGGPVDISYAKARRADLLTSMADHTIYDHTHRIMQMVSSGLDTLVSQEDKH